MTLRRSITVVVALGMASSATTAEWTAQPSLSLGADVDTNRRLAAQDEASHGARLIGSLELATATANSRLSVKPRFEVRRFDGTQTVLDSEDAGADVAFERRGERASLSVNGSLRQDSTLTSELEDTGIVAGSAQRRTMQAGAQGIWRTGERSLVQAGAAWQDVSFDDADGTGLTPYRYPSVYAGVGYDLTERSSLTLSANAGRLEVGGSPVRIDNLSARARWNFRLRERFEVEVNGGLNRTANERDADQGAVFGVSGAWRHPRGTVSVAVLRDVEPSALGRMMRADSVTASCSWQAHEHLWLSLGLRHLRRTDLLFGLFPERRDYSTANASLNWRPDPDWNVELRLGAARQEFELLRFAAHGERAALSVTWAPRRMTLAR